MPYPDNYGFRYTTRAQHGTRRECRADIDLDEARFRARLRDTLRIIVRTIRDGFTRVDIQRSEIRELRRGHTASIRAGRVVAGATFRRAA